MASRPDWFRISAVLRKRRCLIDVLSGAGRYGLCATEDEGEEEGGDEEEEGESVEQGGEGVCELDTDGELMLSELELC